MEARGRAPRPESLMAKSAAEVQNLAISDCPNLVGSAHLTLRSDDVAHSEQF